MTDDDDLADLIGPPYAKRKLGPAPSPSADPLKLARARSAEAAAEWNETKTAKLKGELVDAGEVAGRYAMIVADARARLLAVPSRVAAKLPHLSVADVAAIEAEIRSALSDLADGGGVAAD